MLTYLGISVFIIVIKIYLIAKIPDWLFGEYNDEEKDKWV